MNRLPVEDLPQVPTGLSAKTEKNKKPPDYLLSISQLIVNIICFCILTMSFIGLFLMAGINLIGGDSLSGLASLSAFAWTDAGLALLMIPSIFYTILRLLKKPDNHFLFNKKNNLFIPALFLLPFLLVLGMFLTSSGGVMALFASPLNILVVCIPLWAIFELSTHGLRHGSSQRTWGILSFGLSITPFLAAVFEILLVLVVVIVLIFWFMHFDPAAMLYLNRLQMRFSNSGGDQEVLQHIIQIVIKNPMALYFILSMVSGFIPMIEELFKPLGIWFLINHRISPEEGFTAGVISGLAFAVIESTNAMTMAMNSDWVLTALTRMGAGLVHMTTTGLLGWALVSAFKEGKYGRLIITFILSVSIHGIWNLMGTMLVLSPLMDSNGFLKTLGQISPVGLVIMMGTMLLILLGANRILKRKAEVAQVS